MKSLFSFLLVVVLFAAPFHSDAQTSYFPLHSEEEHLLNRIETKSGVLSPYCFGFRPISRKDGITYLKSLQSTILHGDLNLSAIDYYDIRRAISISSEWLMKADGMDAAIPSKKPIFHYFYRVQPDMIHIHTDDFFLVVNPVIYAEAIREKNQNKIGYINTRGIEVRGRIFNKIGFYTALADDQERPPTPVSAFEKQFHAFPGHSYYRYTTKTGNYDFFLSRGYLDAGFLKDHLNITFGYDYNFSGVGYRSLVLSDFSAPATFLRLRAHWKKFGYQSLFLQLTSDFDKHGDYLRPKKYAAIHQLGYRALRWLNLGVFESTVFGDVDELKATDIIPVIGYQSLARSLGANQKTFLGLWFKALALHHLQLYGQAYFGNINFSEINNSGWWGNRFGLQLGGKYFDAFTLNNLDLQIEFNLVRPFTYSASDGIKNYTNYNMPLAHPDGAGFGEMIAQIRYQPFKRLYVTAKGIFSLRGTDSNLSENNGVNLFKNWSTRSQNNGYSLIPGANRKSLYLNLNLAYEIRPNLFLEAGATHWNWEKSEVKTNTIYFYGGVRWNIPRTERDSY